MFTQVTYLLEPVAGSRVGSQFTAAVPGPALFVMDTESEMDVLCGDAPRWFAVMALAICQSLS